MMKNNLKAVVLLSGGIDSATTLAIAKDRGFDVYALSFRYGQRHVVELEAAKLVALRNNVVEHLIIDIDLRRIGGSALTADIAVPKSRNVEQMGEKYSSNLRSGAQYYISFLCFGLGGGDRR